MHQIRISPARCALALVDQNSPAAPISFRLSAPRGSDMHHGPVHRIQRESPRTPRARPHPESRRGNPDSINLQRAGEEWEDRGHCQSLKSGVNVTRVYAACCGAAGLPGGMSIHDTRYTRFVPCTPSRRCRLPAASAPESLRAGRAG